MKYEIKDFNALRDALHDMCARLHALLLHEQSVFDCKLVANELLSNVLQHGEGRAFFSVQVDGGILRVCVKGENDYMPPENSSCSSVFSDRGRGLFLVDTISESRTYTPEEGICVKIRILKKED